MFFTSSDKKERHRFIDNSIEAADGVLDHDEATRYFGSAFVSIYQRHLNELYVPNYRHGKALIKDVDDELTPIFALKPGESVSLPDKMRLPSSRQRVRASEILTTLLPEREHCDEATIDRVMFDSKKGSLNVSMYDDHAAAFVTSAYNHFSLRSASDEMQPIQIKGRPVMALKYPNGYRVDPSTFIHELQHVASDKASPVRQYETMDDARTNRLREELQAYHVQSLAILAMVGMGYEPHASEKSLYSVTDGRVYSPVVGVIETIRDRTNKDRDDKFYPDEEIVSELKEYDIDII